MPYVISDEDRPRSLKGCFVAEFRQIMIDVRAVCLIASSEHLQHVLTPKRVMRRFLVTCARHVYRVYVWSRYRECSLGLRLCPTSQALPYYRDAHRPLPIIGSCTPDSSSQNQRSVLRIIRHGVSSSVASARRPLSPPD